MLRLHRQMTEDMHEEQGQQSAPSHEQKPDDTVVTVVLTSENHLGYAAFGQQPRKREERQQRLRRAFQQATDFAIGQGVDFFIQAGDLFDTTEPDERDRSFVATRLAQLKNAGVRTFALGGVHDTPAETSVSSDEQTLAPQLSYARLGALHYFAPGVYELEPVIVDIRSVRVGICGLGVLAGQEGDPVTRMRVQSEIERADIPLLILHAPIEGVSTGASLLDTRALVSRSSLEKQEDFRYVLAGYHHAYSRLRCGTTEVILPGATQHIDFSQPDDEPGFVYLGLDAQGIRWCNHIPVDSLSLHRLTINTQQLWSQQSDDQEQNVTDEILERLRPLCSEFSMVQLVLEGELTRGQYHQLDLNRIRRYGEEHSFALAIDDSKLVLLSDLDVTSAAVGERISTREELISLADEWIAAATDEQEKKALRITKEELLAAMDEVKSRH